MVLHQRFGWPGIVASFLLLLLSLSSFAATSPLPAYHFNDTLVVRAGAKPKFDEAEILPTITKSQYVTYLKKYFKETDNYLFYSAGADKKQIPRFMKKNKKLHDIDYFFYGNMITAPEWENRKKPPPDHPWYKEFDANKVQDDGEEASMALAEVATGTVLAFGAVDYKKFTSSFFTSKEIATLHKGIKDGRITAIHHMAKGARSKDDIIAIEDEHGNIVFQPGMEGTENASMDCGGENIDSSSSEEDADDRKSVMKRALGKYGICGPPKIPSKRPPQECSAKHGNGKRAMGSKKQGATCPLKKPTCTMAMKQAGKCGTKKCTAAMKKAGKCGTKKCTVAMKKAGKCGTKKTPKHAAKKKPTPHRMKTSKKRPSRTKKTSKKGRGRGKQ